MSSELSQLLEVVPFLADTRADVRATAVDLLIGYTEHQEAIEVLKSSDLIKNLSKLSGDTSAESANKIMSCLINLSTDSDMTDQMLENEIISRLLENLNDKENPFVELSAMLLSNLTRGIKGCEKLLGEKLLEERFYPVVEWFFESAYEDERDPLKWIGTVLMNISQLDLGREFLLEEKRVLVPKMLEQLEHPNTIRRGGIIGCLKNCCLDTDSHSWLLGAEINVLPPIVRALISGLTEYDEDDLKTLSLDYLRNLGHKPRENVAELRKMLVETLFILGHTYEGRKKMRDSNVYAVVREMDKDEEDEEVKEAVLNLVNVLQRDFEQDILDNEGEQSSSSSSSSNVPAIEEGQEQVDVQTEEDLALEQELEDMEKELAAEGIDLQAEQRKALEEQQQQQQ